MRSEELSALILSTHPQLLKDLRIESHFRNAMQKLLASTPEPIKENAQMFRRRIHIDGAGWHRSAETCPHLLTVQEALFAGRLLNIRYEYEYRSETAERIVQPLGLVAKRTVWYLVAATVPPEEAGMRSRPEGAEAAKAGEAGKAAEAAKGAKDPVGTGLDSVRTYRVSRIAHAEVLDQTWPYPDSFHLAKYWEQSTERFKRSIPRYVARLRMEPHVRKQWEQQPFLEILGAGPVEEDGRIAADVQLATLEHAVQMVLGFGPSVAVLEPAELREAVIAAARKTLELYAEPPNGGKKQNGHF